MSDFLDIENTVTRFAKNFLKENREHDDQYPYVLFPIDKYLKSFELGLAFEYEDYEENLSLIDKSKIYYTLAIEDASYAFSIMVHNLVCSILKENNVHLKDHGKEKKEYFLSLNIFEKEDIFPLIQYNRGYLIKKSDGLYFLENKKSQLVSDNQHLGLHESALGTIQYTDKLEKICGTSHHSKIENMIYFFSISILTGIAKGSFLEANNYANERYQGGKRIIEWSEIKNILGTMETRLNQLQFNIENLKHDEPKLKSLFQSTLDFTLSITNDGIQVLGGAGYTCDYGQEKRYRDARQFLGVLGQHNIN